jgi:hypothetical protein
MFCYFSTAVQAVIDGRERLCYKLCSNKLAASERTNKRVTPLEDPAP